MSRWKDGQRVPTTIFEAATLHLSIKVHCGVCKHAPVIDAPSLWWRFQKRRLDDDFASARLRLWCTKCALGGRPRQRPSFLEAVRAVPDIYFEPPPDREWKRAASRYRA